MGPLVLHAPQYPSPTPRPSPRPIRPAPPHSRGGLLYHQCRYATIPIPTPPPGLFGPPPPTPGGGCYTLNTLKTCLPPALRPAHPRPIRSAPPTPGLLQPSTSPAHPRPIRPAHPPPEGGLITISSPSKPLQHVSAHPQHLDVQARGLMAKGKSTKRPRP